MSHEITIRANGFAEFARSQAGGAAWHGLGQTLTHGATIEEWTRAAGMDWMIRRAMVRYFADEDTRRDCFELREFPEQTVLFRSDTQSGLGTVSPAYQIVQPREVLEFFRDLIADEGMTLESAGTLFGGRRFFGTAKFGEQTVIGQDRVCGYLLLATSADGSLATEARETTVRVVCNNTLRAARAENGKGQVTGVEPIRIGHRSRFNAKRVHEQLGMVRDNFERGMQAIRALANVKVTNAGAEEFVRRLLRPEEFTDKALAAKAAAQVAAQAAAGQMSEFARLIGAPLSIVAETKEKRAPRGEGKILELFASSAMGGTLTGAQGTAWGLVNAVTEYVDHHASAKTPDHRQASAMFGDGDDLKTRAFELAGSFFA